MKSLLILGCGGHGMVVAETARLMKAWDKICFLDNKFPEVTESNHIPVLAAPDAIEQFDPLQWDIIVAIGDNEIRLKLTQNYINLGFHCPTIIHPQAVVSSSVSMGAGTVVFANAVINACAEIGRAAIINTSAVVEHECRLGDGVHISPNATLAGNVHIGDLSWIGAAAVVINNIVIGSRVMVGAGAVVIRTIGSKDRVVGSPAKSIYKTEEVDNV